MARELAQKKLEAAQSKFEVGMAVNFEVIQAQRDLDDAKNSELSAILAYRTAVVNYKLLQETGVEQRQRPLVIVESLIVRWLVREYNGRAARRRADAVWSASSRIVTNLNPAAGRPQRARETGARLEAPPRPRGGGEGRCRVTDMKKLFITLIVLILVGAGGAAAYFYTPPVPDPDVMTGTISRGDVIQTVSATGTLEAVQTVLVGTQVTGIVKELHSDFNKTVKKGQLLARLDRTNFEAALEQQKAGLHEPTS